jgi:hypothetical protein
MRHCGNDRRSEAGARLEMRGRQRIKTVPFAHVRQAANRACVVALELRRMQSGIGSFCETAGVAADQVKAIASNRLLDGPASPA